MEKDERYYRVPDYLETGMEQCKQLTRVLAAIDDKLFCAWNKMAKMFEVWGPSKEYGYCCLTEVRDPYSGRPCSPEAYPMVILADLRARDHDPDVRKALDRQAKLVEKRWLEWMDTLGEEAKYVGAAVAQEASGSPLRHGVEDMVAGLKMARAGTTRLGPVGQRIYIPGV